MQQDESKDRNSAGQPSTTGQTGQPNQSSAGQPGTTTNGQSQPENSSYKAPNPATSSAGQKTAANEPSKVDVVLPILCGFLLIAVLALAVVLRRLLTQLQRAKKDLRTAWRSAASVSATPAGSDSWFLEPQRKLDAEQTRARALEDELNAAQTARFQVEALLEAMRDSARSSTATPQVQMVPLMSRGIIHVRDWIQLAADGGAEVPALRQVDAMLRDVLAAEGVSELASAGDSFDPTRHHAVSTVSSNNGDAGTIAETVRPGYVYCQELIRPEEIVLKIEPAQ